MHILYMHALNEYKYVICIQRSMALLFWAYTSMKGRQLIYTLPLNQFLKINLCQEKYVYNNCLRLLI
jgi:hypothetical protein